MLSYCSEGMLPNVIMACIFNYQYEAVEINGIIMIRSFRTDRSGQTVQTQIRLLLEEQSDKGLHCLQFRLHLLGASLFSKVILFKF